MGAQQLKRNEIDGLVYGIAGETWSLPTRCQSKMQLRRVSDGVPKVFMVVRSSGIISYNPVNARKIRKVLRGIKGIQAVGSGVNFDYAKKADEDVFEKNVQTVNCFNELVHGDFGEEGLKFALNLVFRGGLRIRQGDGFPICYLPGYAKQADGLTVTEFANKDIMSRATYIWRNNELIWLPGQGLNAFVVKHNIRSRTVHMTEITQTINATLHKTGAATISFHVGC